jgi:hypothetical protein
VVSSWLLKATTPKSHEVQISEPSRADIPRGGDAPSEEESEFKSAVSGFFIFLAFVVFSLVVVFGFAALLVFFLFIKN